MSAAPARDAPSGLARALSRAGELLVDRGFDLGTRLLLGTPRAEQVQRAAREVREAVDLFRARGWLEDPQGYHRALPPPEPLRPTPAAVWTLEGRVRYRHLRFASGYEPHEGEPGRLRWLRHPYNGTVHVHLLEHDPRRPWLVCLHGFGMGTPRTDFAGFRAMRWFDRGLNLAFPVLPLHGARGSARLSGAEVFDLDYLRMVHLFAQAASDVRRLVGWLRQRGASTLGLHGISLGGYVAALVASLEDGIDCVIAGIPAVDFPKLARDHEPPALRRQPASSRPSWQQLRAISHPVSPLAFPPRVPREGRFIYAGRADRVVRPEQPSALWRHWEEPEIHWFDGGHVLGVRGRSIGPFVARALERTGLLR